MTAGPSAEVPARSALPRRVLAGYALGSLLTGFLSLLQRPAD